MLRHRPIAEPDFHAICGFFQNEEELFFAFPKATYPLTTKQLRHSIEARVDPTVIERGGVAVGFANFYRWESGICYVGNVVVAPGARDQGVASYLIRTMAALAKRKHNAREVRVSCFNANVGGLLTYSRLGFEPFDIEKRQALDGKFVALIHLRKRLD